MLPKLTLTNILSTLFLLYIAHSIYTLYSLFFPKVCHKPGSVSCLSPAYVDSMGRYPEFQLRVYASRYHKLYATNISDPSQVQQILKMDGFDVTKEFSKQVSIEIPEGLRRNGTWEVFAFLLAKGSEVVNPDRSGDVGADKRGDSRSVLTTWQVPEAKAFKLVKDEKDMKDTDEPSSRIEKPVTHLRSVLPLAMVADAIHFDRREIPAEVLHLLFLTPNRNAYKPIFFIDELSYRLRDLVEVKPDTMEANITITYRPISIGKLRLLTTARHSMEQMKGLGFGDKDLDEMKGIFVDTNFYFLALTFAVAAVHLLLDFLAFKNDIHFWRGRKTMVGLSTKTVLWRCFSQTVIFFYLLDQNTSLLVLIPAGLGTIIEFWKITKAFKIHFYWHGIFPSVRFGAQTKAEVETDQFDSQGMIYLAYLLTPLSLCGAGYSLFFMPHKSWWSWLIESLANGVYAFGFLFMLPQLFVNYRLKSVAHLPWRAFTYKAFNTFIDDLFAFIITMPTTHRLACFRDDVVFLIYLYQRYLYPVDKNRVNEFGESFEDAAAAAETSESKKEK